MPKYLVRAYVNTTKKLTSFKKEIDQSFVNNDVKLEELEIKRLDKGSLSFVSLISNSKYSSKIKKILNKLGKVTWFVVISGTSATKKKHKKWAPKLNKTLKANRY